MMPLSATAFRCVPRCTRGSSDLVSIACFLTERPESLSSMSSAHETARRTLNLLDFAARYLVPCKTTAQLNSKEHNVINRSYVC